MTIITDSNILIIIIYILFIEVLHKAEEHRNKDNPILAEKQQELNRLKRKTTKTEEDSIEYMQLKQYMKKISGSAFWHFFILIVGFFAFNYLLILSSQEYKGVTSRAPWQSDLFGGRFADCAQGNFICGISQVVNANHCCVAGHCGFCFV